MKRKIVLVDANIFIHLNRFLFFDLSENLSRFYYWDIRITPSVENECKDLVTTSKIQSLLREKVIDYFIESSKEVTEIIKDLSIRMYPGAEIELFAIGKYRGCKIITDDIENTTIFWNYYYGRQFCWVYNFEKLLYLAYKADILSIKQIQDSLIKSDKDCLRKISHPIIKNYGFKLYCEKLDENVNKHIDPADQAKFIN